jgi:hypothetical protein
MKGYEIICYRVNFIDLTKSYFVGYFYGKKLKAVTKEFFDLTEKEYLYTVEDYIYYKIK